jgi:alcohol dehydrogenase (cytochrome c)
MQRSIACALTNRAFALAMSGSALFSGLTLALSPSMAAELRDDIPGNWPMYNRTYDGTRYSPLKEIAVDNVQNLQVAWIAQVGNIREGLMETPLVIDGVVYSIGAMNRVQALDAATGKEIWHYYPRLDDVVNEIFLTAISRGVAFGDGRIYFGTLDGRGIALDAKTGKELWSAQIVPTRKCGGCNFTSAPVYAENVVVFGQTGGDIAQQGKIFGLDPATGKIVWAFETLKDDPKSWGGDSRKFGGGGAWQTGAYDPKTKTVFYGTGNPAPDYDPGDARPGDNKWTSSVVALDAATGNLKWGFQEVPHDLWDYDSATGLITFVERNGKRSLVHYNKSGFVYVYDPESGALQNVWRMNKIIDWVESIDPKTGELKGVKTPKMGVTNHTCPWLVGSWEAPSYSPDTGLLYQNVVEACNSFDIQRMQPETVPLAGLYYGGSPEAEHPPGAKAYGHLDARDPLTGEVKWELKFDQPMYSSLLTTAGGLLFAGDLKGNALAYDAATGKQLWSFYTGSGFRGGPVTYTAGGHQYVLFPSGLGGLGLGFVTQLWPEVANYPAGGALVAFRLK